MPKEKIQLTETFAVSAEKLYKAWLSHKEHTAFTGGTAHIKNKENTDFQAWDGYIVGEILELEENKRILHSWRTEEFPRNAENSFLEILLEDVKEGCKLTLNHWDIPENQGEKYKQGWKESYFDPMKNYFKKK
jgi:activator of HSP90 ATPase